MKSATKNTLAFVLFCSFGATREQEHEGVSARTYVTEGEDVVLHCSSGGNLEVVDWKNKDKEVFLYDNGRHYENGRCCQDDQYRGRASLFYDELKNGNASMILRNTRVEDAGIYTCVLPRLWSGEQRSTTELIVEPVYKNRFGLEKGAVQAPFLGISDVTEAGVELQCVVRGSSSKPSVEWETCEGISLKATNQTVSETQGRDDTTRFVIVTKTETNCFSCVVKQKDIYHKVHQEITLSEKLFEKKSSHVTDVHDTRDSRGNDAGALVGMWLFGAAVGFLGAVALCWLGSRDLRRRNQKNQANEDREMVVAAPVVVLAAVAVEAAPAAVAVEVEEVAGMLPRSNTTDSAKSRASSKSSYYNVSSNSTPAQSPCSPRRFPHQSTGPTLFFPASAKC